MKRCLVALIAVLALSIGAGAAKATVYYVQGTARQGGLSYCPVGCQFVAQVAHNNGGQRDPYVLAGVWDIGCCHFGSFNLGYCGIRCGALGDGYLFYIRVPGGSGCWWYSAVRTRTMALSPWDINWDLGLLVADQRQCPNGPALNAADSMFAAPSGGSL